MSPATIKLNKANKVTLRGKNLKQVKKVHVGTKRVKKFKVSKNGKKLTFASPKFTNPGSRWVKINGKTLDKQNRKFAITYSSGSSPVINKIITAKTVTSGERITIQGKRLSNVKSVLINGAKAKSLKYKTATSLTAIAPKGKIGAKINVQVVTAKAASKLTSKTVLSYIKLQQANELQEEYACLAYKAHKVQLQAAIDVFRSLNEGGGIGGTAALLRKVRGAGTAVKEAGTAARNSGVPKNSSAWKLYAQLAITGLNLEQEAQRIIYEGIGDEYSQQAVAETLQEMLQKMFFVEVLNCSISLNFYQDED